MSTPAPKRSHHKPKPPTILLKTGQPVDPPPGHLGQVGKICYQKVVADLMDMGVADRADSRSIEAFASAYEEYRDARRIIKEHGLTMVIDSNQRGVYPVKRPEVDIMSAAWTRMRSLLPELYLTPASRSKAPASTKPSEAKDPWEDLIPEDKS